MKKMKKIMKSWLVYLLALATLLAVSACGAKGGDNSSAKDPEVVMLTAAEKLKQIKSLSFNMDMDMGIKYQGQTMNLGTSMNTDIILEPMIAHSTMRISLLGLETEIYTVQESDGSLSTYTGLKQGDQVLSWSKLVINADDLEALQAQVGAYQANESFATQLEISDQLKYIGNETINDKKADRYDGVIHGKDIAAALAQSGSADTLNMLGIDPAKADKDVPISIWIYEDGTPAKYDIDMTEVMGQMLAQSEETAGMELTAMHVTLLITDANNIQEIVIPQEVLDAEEVSMDSTGN